MNKSANENTQRGQKMPNYAQAARSTPSKPQSERQRSQHKQQQQQQQQQQEDASVLKSSSAGSASTHHHKNLKNKEYNNSNTNHTNNNGFKKAPVQLPMQPPSTDTVSIQFGSIKDSPSKTSTNKTRDTQVFRSSETQFTNSSDNVPRPRVQNNQKQHHQQEIPRSPRTSDKRLFTQAYAPRRDLNQGDHNINGGGRFYKNNNHQHHNNSHHYGKHSPYQQNYHHQQQPYYQASSSSSPPSAPPPLQQQQQQQQYPQPMSSPNYHHHHPKKNNNTPPAQIPNNNWNHQPNPQYYISPPQQYQLPVYVPQNRSPVSKAIPIINPLTKTTLSFDPNAPVLPPPPDVTDEKIEFKVPDTASRAVSIVNPASKGDKELESAENRKAIEEKESKQLEHDEEQKKKEEERLKKEEEEKQKEIEREKIIRRIEEDELKRIEEAKKKEEQIVAQKVGMVPPIDTFTRPLTESPVSTPLEKTKATQASTIRKIDDPSVIEYPPNISSFPTTSIKETGRFIYSPEFLRQFQALCNETSQDLSAIEAANSIMDETSMQRKQSMDRTNSRGPTTPTGSLLNSPLVPNSGGDPMFRMNSREGGNRMEMGKFNMGRPLIPRTPSGSIEHHHPFSTPMQKSANLSGRGRGGMKIFRNPTQNIQGGPTIPLEQVAPLEKSENRWVPHAKETPQEESELIPQATIIRKVNALLNKITLEKFDSIAEQIFHYAHQSAKEKDGKTLRTVIKLLFNKACDEPAFAGMWGQLCRYLFSHMKDDIQDVNLVENDKPVSGSILFRKYLFNRCQKEFERGWKVNMPKMENAETLMTDEYYAAAKAKRQGLGLIQFVGEMYKLQMLSYSVMKSCITKLAEGAETACDEEVESLCKFITTVGKVLDKKEDTKSAVDHSIHLMTNVIPKSPNITNRVKFMMLDVIDLRKNKWVPRNDETTGPTTIAKIHEMAEKAKEEKEQAMKRNNSSRGQYNPNQNNNNKQGNPMARTGSYRGNRDYNNSNPSFNNSNGKNNNNAGNNGNNGGGGDGWNTVGSNISPGGPNKNRMNGLSNFGKTDRSKTRPNHLGPSNSPFPSLNRGKSTNGAENKDSATEARASPATNMFSALLNNRDEEDNKPEERKKLNLKPRTVAESSTEKKEEKLSDDVVKSRSKNILEEYFSIRDKKELSECIKELDDVHYREIFIGEILAVVEKKASDVDQMCDAVTYLCDEKLLEKSVILTAFKSFMEGYDDLTIDVPQAHKYVAKLLVSFSMSPSEVGGEEFPALEKAYDEIKCN